ncbi:Rubber elongation factor [Dillenia turbinata]|uniref:Rubber elongation factor n=1 Tax=Dillenia turbinata TaxID=194707 RepID=A0AAN8UQI0_9MAGN
MYTKYEPAAKELYSKYEPVAEQYAVSAWRSLNRLPLFPQVAQVVLPKAAYCSEKYNETVKYAAEKGYTIPSYLPLVPTQKIAKSAKVEKPFVLVYKFMHKPLRMHCPSEFTTFWLRSLGQSKPKCRKALAP